MKSYETLLTDAGLVDRTKGQSILDIGEDKNKVLGFINITAGYAATEEVKFSGRPPAFVANMDIRSCKTETKSSVDFADAGKV